MMLDKIPYLSIVVASRNDNHGGDMLQRMNIFVAGLIHQCNKYKLNCELIFVEWNPPIDKESLSEVLPKTSINDYLTIRYILVPDEIHRQYSNSDKLPLFQMIAKNVGIRRAKAEFILCTNVDLLFSDKLFEHLSRRDLKPGVFYRANRCDVSKLIYTLNSVDEQLSYAQKNTLKRLGKNFKYTNFADTNGLFFKYKAFQWFLPYLSRLKSTYATSLKDKFNELDLDACGDFTLMSKTDWERISGYVELEIYSIHIDSMGLISALAMGLKQEVFEPEACTYHIEHDGGWEFKSPSDKLKFYTKFPMLEWSAVKEAGIELLNDKKNWEFNKPNWGLADVDLKEL